MSRSVGLYTKFVLPLVGATLVILTISSWFIFTKTQAAFVKQTELAVEAFHTEQKLTQDKLLANLTSKADTVGQLIAKAAVDFVLIFDFTSLQGLQEYASKDADIAYINFLKPDRTVMVENTSAANSEVDVIEKTYEINNAGSSIGYVAIGMSTAGIHADKTASAERTEAATTKIKDNGSQTSSALIVVMIVATLAVIALITLLMTQMFRRLVLIPLNEATNLISVLAEGRGDLTVELPVRSEDEIGKLSSNVNRFVRQLRDMMKFISLEVSNIDHQAHDLSNYSTNLLELSSQQNSRADQVAVAIEELQTSVADVAKNTAQAATTAEEGKEKASDGQMIITKTVQSTREAANDFEITRTEIASLSKDVERISGVLGVINDIANMTNLLALNASIEAARAGELGKGFAVVADEVRSLATRTQQSTLEIEDTLKLLQKRTSAVTETTDKGLKSVQGSVNSSDIARNSFDQIAQSVMLINDMNVQIACATEEQSSVAREISTNVHTMQQFSKNTTECAEKTNVASQELAGLAERLNNLVAQFKTS